MKIKYDIKTAHTLTIWASMSGILFALAVAGEYMNIAGTELFLLFGTFGGGAVFLFCGLHSMAAHIYLGLLKRYGYEIPENAKDFDRKLENLARDEEIYQKAIADQGRKSKTSIANGILFLLCFTGCLVIDILFYKKWAFFGENGKTMTIFMILCDMVWLGFSVYYFKQSNKAKYRDIVELDETRKPRTTLVRGIVNICILMVLTFGVKNTASTMTNYIFRSSEAYDQNWVCDIQGAIQTVYEERIGMDMAFEKRLAEGITIDETMKLADLDEKEAEFWEQVFEYFGIDDFNKFVGTIHVSERPATLSIKLKEDTIVVELLNPSSLVKQKIKSTGQDSERVEIH